MIPQPEAKIRSRISKKLAERPTESPTPTPTVRHTSKFSRVWLFLLPVLVAACSGGDDDKKKKNAQPKNFPPPTVHEEGLHNFTGARTKVVWTQYQNPDKVDKQGTSRHHHLMAIDTDDGSGERKVLEERANYAYPILTPDGEQIVFTRKVKVTKGSKRKFDVTIDIVNFDGTGLKTLGKGYAQEVWEDPATGKYWVYAGDDFVLADSTAPICKRIIRFPIDDPSKRETVWDKTKMGTDSFAISADGKRFAGLFPWPDAGIGDLEKNKRIKTHDGCWVSMAPDNSYDSWVFDGPHKNFFMFNGAGEQTATVPVNNHPALKGAEVYHPRWGNHRQFFVLSGPHISKKKKGRGKPVEIFLGKFSPELDHVESWFQVTKNGLADIYPDIWVEGGASSGSSKAAIPIEVAEKPLKWPSNPDQLLFEWKNVRVINEIATADGNTMEIKTQPAGFAHYGPNYEMNCTSGTFHSILDSDALLEKAAGGKTLSFQALVTTDSKDGAIFSNGTHSLSLADGRVHYSAPGLDAAFKNLILPTDQPSTHIAVVQEGQEVTVYLNGQLYINGQRFPTQKTTGKPSPLVFGKDLDGQLEHIAFYSRPLTAAEVAADYSLIAADLAKRTPIKRTKLKGKLIAVSPVKAIEDIEPYVRSLVHYAYETDNPKFKTIAVAHWAILDRELVPGLPREIGKTYDLLIEPISAHTQLDSQDVSSEIDELLMLYYDVTPLKPRK